MRKNHLIFIILFLAAAAIDAYATAFDDVKFTFSQKATLEVSATIYEGDEDERQMPLAGDFYLMPQSIVVLLKAEKFQLADETNPPFTAADEVYLEALAEAVSGADEESALLSSFITDVITENRIASVKVSNFGRGKSRKVLSGDYYLFGYARSNNELFVWNLPVILLPGSNRVEIDQYNADAVIDIW